MGKTFVALGVAMVAALADRGRRPVVIMVPSSLHEKWPRDFDVFKSLAIRLPADQALRAEAADSALDFFRLIEKEAKSRPHIIFLKHGAFHVRNIDHWVRLALIKRAILGMHLGERRDALPRFAAALIRTRSSYNDPDLFAKLLRIPSQEWLSVINGHYQGRPEYQLKHHPIPHAIQRVLDSSDIDIARLRECLRTLPARDSATIHERLETARLEINTALLTMWPSTLAKVRFRSPLLVLDEAHHLKNPATRLASLFVTDDAREDAGAITGALDGAFERMMMVTKVGDDLFGENTIKNFASFGIDTRHVSKVAGKSSGVAPIAVEPSGENSILIVKGANAELLPVKRPEKPSNVLILFPRSS